MPVGGNVRPSLLAIAIFAACTGDDPAATKPTAGTPDEDEPPGVDPTTEPDCDNPWVRSSPEDGEGGVFYRSGVEVELTTADPTAALRVEDERGAVVPGESAVDGAVVTWTGGPLAASTDYRAVLTHACGTDLLAFGTSSVGDPVAADLVGQTWALNFAQGTWVEPATAGPAIAVLLEPFRILLTVTGPPEGEVVPLMAGIGYAGDQQWCAPTVDLADSAWADPYFEIATPVLELATHEFSVKITDFATSGAFSADGERIEGATLVGLADTRGLGQELGLGDEPEAVCNLLEGVNVTCLPCADGVETCLDVDIRDISGVLSPVPLEPVTAEDVLANPNCSPQP